MPQVEKETTSEVYLQKAVLEGYRTIKRLEVEFLPGLNVIIGKNGTGKTNVMEYLYRALIFDGKQHFVNAELTLSENTSRNDTPLHIKKKVKYQAKTPNLFKNKSLETLLHIGSHKLENINEGTELYYFLSQNKFLFNASLIRHGLPKEYTFFDKPFNYATDSDNEGWLTSKVFSSDIPLLIRKILLQFPGIIDEEGQDASVKLQIEEAFSILEESKQHLSQFTDIEDIRLSDNSNIFFINTLRSYGINNLFVEFKVHNQWLPYSSLSDGTKRIFYIVSELLASKVHYFFQNTVMPGFPSPENRVILLEEPELGLHPHLLEELMKFLQEQAKHKQIIISTHSPIVLDSIDPYELDRVQIAELTPEGTQLRRLTPEQQKKAQIFADKTGLLSDYWRFSDLEA